MSLKWKEIKFQITDSLKRTKSYSFRERAETIIASQYGQMWIITQKTLFKTNVLLTLPETLTCLNKETHRRRRLLRPLAPEIISMKKKKKKKKKKKIVLK